MRYIQEAPLTQTSRRPQDTPLSAVVKLIQETVRADKDDSLAIASLQHEMQAIKDKLQGHTEVLTELEDRTVAEEFCEEKQLCEKKVVYNADSGIAHEVSIDIHESAPLEACVTRCGWRWALAGACPTIRVPGVGSLPNYCRTCRKRAAGDDSDGSSGPSDDEDERGDPATTPVLDLEDWEVQDA